MKKGISLGLRHTHTHYFNNIRPKLKQRHNTNSYWFKEERKCFVGREKNHVHSQCQNMLCVVLLKYYIEFTLRIIFFRVFIHDKRLLQSCWKNKMHIQNELESDQYVKQIWGDSFTFTFSNLADLCK